MPNTQTNVKAHRFIALKNFSSTLLKWYDQHGRKDLPWQQNKTPYRVWVSEIMLQQTQVTSVIGYYQRFMEHFPTIDALARAKEDAVLAQWAGLGYYARARNLHKTAQIITQEYNGDFPKELEQIIALPGIGRSTAGAICSIAMQDSHPILDGNVKRVLSRLHGIQTWPGERKTEQDLWALASDYTPSRRCDDYTQAIMDIGATLCTRSKPACSECPFKANCIAYQSSSTQQIPASKPKKTKPEKELWLADIRCNKMLLLEKRPSQGIWGGLYSLPEVDRALSFEELEYELERRFGLSIQSIEEQTPFTHAFSHYKLHAHPVKVTLARQPQPMTGEDGAFDWHSETDQLKLGLPAPIKKYLAL
jgi:A/G-specific adenine glycosylase